MNWLASHWYLFLIGMFLFAGVAFFLQFRNMKKMMDGMMNGHVKNPVTGFGPVILMTMLASGSFILLIISLVAYFTNAK